MSRSGPSDRWRDLSVGENPCNLTRETRLPSGCDSTFSCNSTTWRKEWIQARAPVFTAVIAEQPEISRISAWQAGEVEGSGKSSSHDLTTHFELNLMEAKRCLRINGTHDLETRQHALSVVGSVRRLSTMRSRISGRRGGDIVVSSEPGTVRRWPMIARHRFLSIFKLYPSFV